ncbi:MAG: glycoside hydrolase family 20 zincin-like fold domain-containing protein [Segatella copri]
MAKFNRLLGSFVACAAMLGGISTPASAADINIIPIPVKTQVQKGEFVLPQKVVIAYQTAEGRNIAQYMADKLKASTGYEVTVGGKKGNISIQISPSLKIAEEGYRLTVTAKGLLSRRRPPRAPSTVCRVSCSYSLPR